MKKTLFAVAALVAGMSASAEVTPRTPIVPWGAQAETIITNDLTQQNSDGSWSLNADAQKWITTTYDGEESTLVQQTNRANVWYDFYSETTTTYKAYAEDGETIIDKEISCDEMIIGSAASNWGGYLTVTNKAGSTSGLIVVGANRYPHFFVTGTDKAKFYFSGSASKAGYPQIEVYEVGSETPVITKTGDIALTKSTWDKSTLLIADGLDKAKSYEIVCRSMALNAETGEYTHEGGDIVLQVVKFYGDQAPMREDGLIISGSEIGSYINAHLAAYPEVTDFTLEGNGKYTITEGITAFGKFTLTGDASAPATIDASALAAPFVQFAIIAEDAEKDENGFVAATNVKFANIKVNALGQPLFSSNRQNYLIPELNIDNSVIELASNPSVIDFRNGGVVGKLAVSNSTIWAAKATGNSFFTGQSGKKATEAGLEEQIFSFTNCTLSNIAAGKNFFTHRQAGQTWLTFEVKNNIIANCGKDNFLASLNGGQTSPNPKYTVEGITVLKATTEDDEFDNINDLQSTSDETEEIVNPIAGVPFTLANALAGNFKVAANSQQAKYMTGDPRWKTPYATDAIKLEVDMAENTDWVKAINDALAESEAPSSITVQFFEAGEYPTTAELNTTSPITIQNGSDIGAGEATIVVNNGMTLGGQIKIDGVNIKAGAELAVPVITLQANEYKLQDNGFYNLGSIQFKNLSIKSGTQQILYGNKVKNQISELLVENCIVDVDGCTKVPFDFNGGGAIGAFNIKKSTIWAANATSQSLFSTQSGNKATEAGYTTQNFAIDNSLIYNIAKGKNFYTHRQANQTWLAYYLRNSIVVNSGKSGQFVKGMNQGQSGKNPKWTINGNAFFFEVEGELADQSANESTGDEEEPVQNSIAGSIEFTDLTTGDFSATFTLAEGIEEPNSLGDPRWIIIYPKEITAAGDVTYALAVGDTFTSGQVVEVKNEEDVCATIQYGEAGEGYADFKAAKEDGHIEGYTAFTEGNGVNGNKAGGTFYTITPKYDGVVAAAVVLNADKKFHLFIDGEENETFKDNTVSEKYYGPVEFNVKAGKAYKFYCDGSKLGFYGFNYKYGPDVTPIVEKTVAEQQAIVTGISLVENATVNNGVIYNLNGQKVQNAQKGLYIINGKKVVVK